MNRWQPDNDVEDDVIEVAIAICIIICLLCIGGMVAVYIGG